MDVIKLKVLNWEKYNPRRDYKNPWWFALSNRLFEDPKFFDLSHPEIVVWIYILSQASQQKTSSVTINYAHANKICKISKALMTRAIGKFEKLSLIQIDKEICTESVQNLYGICTAHYITLQNNTEQDSIAQSDDFAEIYSLYPKKVGKEKGRQVYKRDIKTKDDVELLRIAITNYKNYLAKERVEARYIKHFSSFMGCWRDWSEATAGDAETFVKKRRGITDILEGGQC